MNEIAITLVDVESPVSDDILVTLEAIDGVKRVRYLNGA